MDAATMAQFDARAAINEGRRSTRYFDSKGIPTTGIGFNLTRGDAKAALAKIGVTDFAGVMAGTVALTDSQIDALYAYSIAPIVGEARASFQAGIFDQLNGPRQCGIVDMVFNMGDGDDGWGGFTGTRALITQGQMLKNNGRLVQAHMQFVQASQHILASTYASDVGDRAKRNAAMIRTGEWCNPTGDGSDLA